jgi:hypothetical protein
MARPLSVSTSFGSERAQGPCATIRWTMTATPGSRDPDTATSHDGRTFSLTMSPHRVFPVGSLVSLTDDEGLIRLGQVETYQLLPDGQMRAAGRVLGTLDGKGLDNGAMAVFGSASVAEADHEMITAMNNGAAANLDIGSIASNWPRS